jgi:hypothetical protein
MIKNNKAEKFCGDLLSNYGNDEAGRIGHLMGGAGWRKQDSRGYGDSRGRGGKVKIKNAFKVGPVAFSEPDPENDKWGEDRPHRRRVPAPGCVATERSSRTRSASELEIKGEVEGEARGKTEGGEMLKAKDGPRGEAKRNFKVRSTNGEPVSARSRVESEAFIDPRKSQIAELTFFCNEPDCWYASKRNKITHAGKRPFACDEPGCGYAASQRGTLKRHKRTHTGERPFACDKPGCGYAASQNNILKRHKMTHTGERPLACDEPGCGYAASLSDTLKSHKLMHTGERPFACDEQGCGYAASRSSDVKKHKRTHTGERPFACDAPGCGYATTASGALKRHNLTHTGERPVACDEPGCRYATTETGNLKKHKRTHMRSGPLHATSQAVGMRLGKSVLSRATS